MPKPDVAAASGSVNNTRLSLWKWCHLREGRSHSEESGVKVNVHPSSSCYVLH